MNNSKINITDLFNAYYDCRSNKRNTANALAFEVNYESNLMQLYEEIINGTYTPGRSIAFVVEKPVKREIFAADFRDRIVHHLIINKLNPLFEKQFIYDSYSCRVNKGTHFGINRVTRFIRQCSQNYKLPCYILKLDIEGFFMHIDKNILFNRLHTFINEKYTEPDKELLVELCKKVIFNNPVENCIIKGNNRTSRHCEGRIDQSNLEQQRDCFPDKSGQAVPRNDDERSAWYGLPKTKSLFHSPVNCGLPIGNLTSQILANFYLDSFDHYIKHDLQIKYYGRYVDDFVIVHNDKEYLKSLIPQLYNFLLSTLQLTLHPRKIYLQPYQKGVKFLGVVIKPNRTYIANRTKGNFYKTIEFWNKFIKENNNKLSRVELKLFLSSINSYLGIMKHYKTYKLRKKMLLQNPCAERSQSISAYFWNYVYISGGFCKLVSKIRKIKNQKNIYV